MKFNEIKRETKRRIYALALASIMVLLPKTKAYAAEVDMSTKVDVDHAISVLVPSDKPSSNNGGKDDNKGNNNDGKDDSKDNNNGGKDDTKDNNNDGKDDSKDNNNDGKDDSKDNNNDGKDDTKDDNNDGKDDTKDDNIDNNDDNKEAENEEENKCDHSYVSVDVTNQKTPSCTVAGSYDEVYQCSKCGATKTEHHTIPAPGHKWDGGTRVETKDGYDIIYHCTNKGCSSEKKTHHSNTPDPTEPTKPHKPTNPSDNPKMGDVSHINEWKTLMLLSGTALPFASYQLYKILEEEKKQQKLTRAEIAANEYKGKYLSKR